MKKIYARVNNQNQYGKKFNNLVPFMFFYKILDENSWRKKKNLYFPTF